MKLRDANYQPLALHIKLFSEQHRNACEGRTVAESLAPTAGEISRGYRSSESLWLLAHKIVAFTQSFVQQEGWSQEIMQWLFVINPWWSLEPGEAEQYSGAFLKDEWLQVSRILLKARRRALSETDSQKSLTTEAYALLRFLADSQSFVENLYRMSLEATEPTRLLDSGGQEKL
jgi:hypothetical protein